LGLELTVLRGSNLHNKRYHNKQQTKPYAKKPLLALLTKRLKKQARTLQRKVSATKQAKVFQRWWIEALTSGAMRSWPKSVGKQDWQPISVWRRRTQ
jgi:hypothetical protein